MRLSTRRDMSRRHFLTLTAGAAVATWPDSRARAAATEERPDLNAVFQEHGVVGAFSLYDVSADRFVVVDRERAERRYVPASTFKIANSLIALETGVVRDENEVIPYGGKPQPFESWEKDMPMREAITASSVPVYQELARRIGIERYRLWLDRLDYGNREVGHSVQTFWLDGPLEISAVEQVRFAARLAQQRLPMSVRSQLIVRDILRLESGNGFALYGKTGWRFSSTLQIGWWTGWVERDGKSYSFALNIDMASAQDAPKRLAIGKALLARLGVL